MNTKYPWILIPLIVLLSVFLVDVRSLYAQEALDAQQEGGASQLFSLRDTDVYSSARVNAQGCTLAAELRWYKRKDVKIIYHWQDCRDTYTVRWELASIHTVNGVFTLNTGAGKTTVYNANWPELRSGDTLTLHTWVNDVQQADVVTKYLGPSPIFARIYTRQDAGGACFQFVGHIDPWGVFTAGDYSYTLELSTEDWVTPWLVGPNKPTVNWHAQFYQDPQLTKLRSEYWFNNVPNPCYAPPPATCDSITLSIPNGSPIAADGAAIDVTIVGQHGSQYRIVDETGNVVAGPSTTPALKLHALPGIVYQGQLYSEKSGWTTAGCQFQYGAIARPACNSVTLQPSADTLLPPSGQQVQVTIAGENGTQYQIVDASGQVVAGPSTEPVLPFQALPNVQYQAQVYNETYGWTTSGCQFQYGLAERPVCEGVTLNPAAGSNIPFVGQPVAVTIHGKNASQYRVVDTADNTVAAGPSATNRFALQAKPGIRYQAQLYNEQYGWTNQGCTFSYGTVEGVSCQDVVLSVPNGTVIPAEGTAVDITVKATGASRYRLVNQQTGAVVAGPSADVYFKAVQVKPNVDYQAQVLELDGFWSTVGCTFRYTTPPPPPTVCQELVLSIPSGSVIPEAGTAVVVTVIALNATQYRLVDNTGAVVAGPGPDATLRFQALPGIVYQAQVANDNGTWTNSGCQFSYTVEPVKPAACIGVALSVPNGAAIAADGVDVAVTINAQNATRYQIVSTQGQVMAGPGGDAQMQIHAMPNVRYQAQVANEDNSWTTAGCDFGYTAERVAAQAFCELRASHYGDPGGRSRIRAWVEGQTAPVAIEKVRINWNQKGEVTYPTKRQTGPWFTNSEFTLLSRPEVFDVGFGYYKYEAWVYVAGIAEPAYCWGDGNAPDHDNVLPDPGPFAQPNPEGKLNRGSTPSRLPTVGRLPFDGGNGPDKVELILWAFEKEGRGVDAKITAIANEGKPLARLGMSSVSDVAKFDGLNAREGIVYGFQIGEHGPWSPLFCPAADNDPTTITVYWAAGGLTWLSDGNAYGDCWWLTVAAALNGWVTVDESVATYNALQPIIDWNGHRNLVFSLAQSRETGLGPRMQDALIGLQAREWQGPVVPTTLPADFNQTVAVYRVVQAK
ncbi:MAG: hypothetical protein ACOYNY_40255 [Caldilineaceae bacterium]